MKSGNDWKFWRAAEIVIGAVAGLVFVACWFWIYWTVFR